MTSELVRNAESWGFPGGSVVKSLPANAGDMGSIPGPERCCMRRSSKAKATAAELACYNYGSLSAYSPCSAIGETTPMRSLPKTTRK